MSKQLLSAAVDAAATEAEWDALIEAMASDPEIKGEWNRIWAMRDAQDDVLLAASPDFCGGVMAAIANEKPLPSTVLPLKARTALPPVMGASRRATWRTLVPLSAAAGVAAAVLMVNVLREAPLNAASGLSASAAVQTAPVPYAAEPDAAKAAILSAYLMEHSNSLAERSMGGTLANARFAARTASYRPDAQ